MIAAGELGELRLVQVEYAQDWLTTALEADRSETSVVAHGPASKRRRRLQSAISARMLFISPSS